MGKLKESKGLYIALSIILAIALWAYVQVKWDPESSTQVKNMAITLSGEDVLESRGLMVSSISPDSASVTFHGATSKLRDLVASRPTVSVDLSRIVSAGEHNLNYNIVYPGSVSASDFTSTKETAGITVSVVPLFSKTIQVEGTFIGEVEEGYQAGELTITPETITVSGEEENVRRVARAVVEVGGEKLTKTFTGELPVTLLDEAGEVIHTDEVRCDVSSVFVTLPVVVVKEVKLTVDLIPGGGASPEKHVNYRIEPSTISVTGSAEDLENLDEISLGELDLSKVFTSTVEIYPINLAKELTNASGIKQATVTVTIEGLEMRTLTVDTIDTINVSDGYRASVVTKSMEVQLRGPAESLEAISPTQVRVSGDLTDIISATGRYTVPARVYFDGPADCGIVGEYSVVVQVTR